MSWSLRAIAGVKPHKAGPRHYRRKSSSRARIRKQAWWDHIQSSALGNPPTGGYVGFGPPARRTLADNMLVGRKNVQAAVTSKDVYRGLKELHGLARAGVRKISGNEEGYRLEYSEAAGSQVFTETYRSYLHARNAAQKMQKKGWKVKVIPLHPKKSGFTSEQVNLGRGITRV